MGPPTISGGDGLPWANTAQLGDLRFESVTGTEGHKQRQIKYRN